QAEIESRKKARALRLRGRHCRRHDEDQHRDGCGGQLYFTGAGAPPPARAYADASLRLLRPSLGMAAGARALPACPAHPAYFSFFPTTPPRVIASADRISSSAARSSSPRSRTMSRIERPVFTASFAMSAVAA